MKLFSKYSRVNLISTIIIFLLGCVAFTVLLRYVIIKQVDEDLIIERNEIDTYIKQFHHFPAVIEVNGQYTSYYKIEKPVNVTYKIFTDKAFSKPRQKKVIRRTVEFSAFADNSWYFVRVSKSLEGTNALIKTIIIITSALIMLILATSFIINRIVLKKLWQPFYSTLETLQQFSLSNNQSIKFSLTDINEFEYLNSALMHALNKAQADYKSLKEFTENASHELQTPLAVIQSKLDNLIQDENLSESQSNAAAGVYEAVNRLNKINQSLLLLTKIENRQFESARIDLKEKTALRIKQFCELAQSRNITIQSSLEESYINMNADLADILLNNLLSNAVKYNIANGAINVALNRNSLSIGNTALPQPLNTEPMFTRFNKSSHNDGHGIGLSIVKQICDVSGCIVMYKFHAPATHNFTVTW